MKAPILYFCIFSFFLTSLTFLTSQSADFPSGEAEWTTYVNYPPDNIFHAPVKQRLLGDSIYQGISYDILSRQWEENEMAGLIRSEGQQVYYIPQDSTVEMLWYDFGMIVGDTFFTPPFLVENGFLNDFHVLGTVDTITTKDGIDRRRLHFGSFTWLQGIGPLVGSVDIYEVPFSSEQHLRYCFTSNFQDVISETVTDPNNGLTYDCDGILNSTEDDFREPLLVSPNPFVDYISISNINDFGSTDISLLDLNGKSLGVSVIGNEIHPLVSLASGVYLLVVRSETGVLSKKVIKSE